MERIISLFAIIGVVGLITHGPLVAALGSGSGANKRGAAYKGYGFRTNQFKESKVLGCSDPHDPSCRPNGPIYDLLVVGGGMAGLSAQYFAITRANVAGNSTILFEKELELGGNIKYVNVTAFDGTTRRRVGTGAQRTPQNTVPHQRALWDELNVTTYYVVWNSRFVGRGRVSHCPQPDLDAYSPAYPDMYSITVACAGNFAMAGNINGDLSILDNATNFGPAYWIPRDPAVAAWDYPNWLPLDGTGTIGGSPYSSELEDAFYNHELYDGVNPVTGEACGNGNCPSDTCYDFAELHTFEQSLFGREYTNFVRELANLGFNGDYFGLTWSPCGRIQYYLREWDTTAIYGYSDNSMHTGIDKLHDRIIMGGGRIYTGEEVLTIDYLDKFNLFLVTTSKRRVFSRRVIGSFEPNAVTLGKINGNIPDALREQDAFKIPVNGTAFTFTVLFDKQYDSVSGKKLFFWDNPAIVAPEVVTEYGVSKRQISPDGCGSRREILSYPDVYDDQTGTGAIRSSYTDFLCQGVYTRILEMTKSKFTVTAKRGWEMLWERLKLDIVAELGVSDASLIPDPRLVFDSNIGGERFEIYPARFDNAWFGTGRDRLDNGDKFTVDDIVEFAKNPVDLPGQFCLAQQAWNNRASGWTEASILTAKDCIKTMFPCTASNNVFENWINDYFPPCQNSSNITQPADELCYSGGGLDDSVVVGGLHTTAIVVPGLNLGGVTNAKFFCNERWWTLDFKKTDNCSGPQPIRSCLAPNP